MLHLAPHLCDMSLAERRVPDGIAGNPYVRFGGRVSFGWLSNDFFPDGYIGDPTAATAEHGEELFDGSVDAFCEALARDRHVRLRALTMTAGTTLRIDGDRLWRRLDALGEIGAVHGPNGERGCARLALTDADRDGRDLVVSWMRDLGLHGVDRRDRQRGRHACRVPTRRCGR